jgi:cytoskeletal protein CcmA (bactofilin family)
MIFKKNETQEEYVAEEDTVMEDNSQSSGEDNIDTVVGPSMIVEGDFASEGNIVVKGTVTGSVCTSKNLTVEEGAKILANVKAGSANVSGEVQGNMRVKDYLELSSTARIIGDIEVRTIAVQAGALLFGKVAMPGMEKSETKSAKNLKGRNRKEMTEE